MLPEKPPHRQLLPSGQDFTPSITAVQLDVQPQGISRRLRAERTHHDPSRHNATSTTDFFLALSPNPVRMHCSADLSGNVLYANGRIPLRARLRIGGATSLRRRMLESHGGEDGSWRRPATARFALVVGRLSRRGADSSLPPRAARNAVSVLLLPSHPVIHRV